MAEVKIIDNPETFFLSGAAEHQELWGLQFGKADVLASLQTIRPTAAPGPDEFPAILLKNFDRELAEALQMLFDRSFRNEIILELMKSSKIPLIYKEILCADPSRKSWKRSSYLETNRLMNPGQHGFRAGHSCLLQLIEHHENTVKTLEKECIVDGVYFDFKKGL